MSISRRSFLQGVGIGCSACALGAFPPGALARNPIAGINGKTTLTPSLCEMCSFRCPIQAQVVNNKTVFIQGNPSAPQQGTRVCARGGSGVSLVNDPQRIVKPMKRTGPRGGGDLAVLLAMCHVMIDEQLYDASFVERYTSGFEQLAQAVKETTPEWAAAQADVPADVIVRVTRELAACAPHAIVSPGHRATFSQEEIDMRRMIFTLNVLLGNIEREGGLYQKKGASVYNKLAGEKVAPTLAKLNIKNMPKPTAQRIDLVAPQFKYIAAGGGVVQSIIDAALTRKPYPIKAWIMSRHNPFQTVTCRPDLVKTVEQLDLVVSCDVYLSESAAYADYLLPECTYLERDEEISDMSGLHPAYALRQQVVEPIGEARPSWQIWKELGEQLGLGQYYPWQDMQTRQLYQLNGDHALAKELRQKGYLEWGVPLLLREPESVRQFTARYPGAIATDSDNTYGEQLRFKSPSGKIELYSVTLEGLLPGYGVPRVRDFALKKENELYFIQGKVAVHTNGATQYVPLLSELMWDNAVWVHPQTAQEKGIKTGDEIWLENATGKEKGKALVTPGIRPDTLFVYMGFGAKAGAKTAATTHGIHCGNLLPHVTSPVSGTVVHTAGVTLSRA